MQITYTPANPLDTMMPYELDRLEKSLPATKQAAKRAALEGLLLQEARGEDVADRIMAVCKELNC